jgi:hypothetical protein
MRGRSEIEWQDRAWRLLQDEGQISVDRWGAVGTAADLGAGVAAIGSRALMHDWRLAMGVAGVGSCVGVIGSMGWRMEPVYGIGCGDYRYTLMYSVQRYHAV